MGGAENLHDGHAFRLARPAIARSRGRDRGANNLAGDHEPDGLASCVCPPNCQEFGPSARPSYLAPVHTHGPEGPLLNTTASGSAAAYQGIVLRTQAENLPPLQQKRDLIQVQLEQDNFLIILRRNCVRKTQFLRYYSVREPN